MTRYRLKTFSRKMLADTITPVSAYLGLRDQFANSILLESSEYQTTDNHFSYLCCKPIATFTVENGSALLSFPDHSSECIELNDEHTLTETLNQFLHCFEVNTQEETLHTQNGLFGYMAYDAVEYVEDIAFSRRKDRLPAIPLVNYSLYQYVLAIDHFRHQLYLYEHVVETPSSTVCTLDHVIRILENRNIPNYAFAAQGAESTNLTDAEYEELVYKGKAHCKRGDVFQIVLSRAFRQSFTGDEFNVYRALRAVNPSPYLFYFDYGSYILFGSSPEAQLTVRRGVAAIHPIAGTYHRTGEQNEDLILGQELLGDPKENAEHMMLVDLARNDLNRHAREVKVETFRELQYYSHVIHLVSKVTGIADERDILSLAASAFPAGTLSGAPKFRAMQLIDQYEPSARMFYGGAIGFIGFHGSYNHAIMIRTFCSQNNVLYYQAGAGIVEKSIAASELAEVNHKIGALRTAIQTAQHV